jgi:DNA-binding response OmpR family regulator
MASTTVLLISSKQPHTNQIITALSKRYTVLVAYSGKEGMALAKEHAPRLIILDAAAMRTTGERVCRTLKQEFPHILIIHIHPGPRREAKSEAHTLLFPPLTARRLSNSVGRLIHAEEEISCGPFSMNVSRRILIAHGEETQLNPKQAALVEMFLRNPNQDLDRKTIMETVWKTDYIGDTRTLDVHIRWIRKVMEKRGAKPRYIKTVRGVGYRLEIPER